MLTMDHLTVQYGSRVVLRDIHLEVVPGEVLALIGPNGAGKTTLIRAASGGFPLTEGTVAVDGLAVRQMPVEVRARRIAVVPQAMRLPESFSVFDTVLMGRTPYMGWLGRESGTDRAIVQSAMERTLTLPLAARRIGELSGGEQQRVLIARALAQEAPFLLMDEPVAYLDIHHQAGILALVCELAHKEGLAVLMALHDLNLAAQYADRVALLAEGRLCALGSPAGVFQPERLSQAYGLPVSVITHPMHGTPLVVTEKP
jgi:ABC-type cobalamin/Fe3+-siderophores transport system ATPase subunit